MSTVEDPLIGRVLSGRFEIVAPIGVGGMGRVYKAIQRPLDRVVALKVLNPRYDGSKDPGFEKRFFLEASMTAKLKHPNTITVHDYGRTDDGVYFLAMEFAEGETLQQVLAQGRLAWPRALFIAAQIARSLREAHKFGLVHRDLKPANIMLLSEGTSGDIVKVLDFGLVKSFMSDLRVGPDARVPSNETEITQAGVLLGSPMYMAPEQARNEADPRTDIYALGVLLFQCIAGRTPFVGTESIDIIVKHIREAPPELRALVPDVPFEVHTLVMKCLQKTPDARFQNMDELLEAMRAATSGQGMSGIFADPRTFSNSTLARTPTPGASLAPQSATPPGMHVGHELDEHSIEVEMGQSGPRTMRRGKLVGSIVGLSILGVAVGGVIAFKATSRIKPEPPPVAFQPAPRPVAVVQPPPPPPPRVNVVFEVSSEPPGATVIRAGTVVGITPFTLPVERLGTTPAQVELAFALDGYEATTVVAQGLEGTIPVRQVLMRKPTPTPTSTRTNGKKKPPKPERPSGYKDDPYQ